ncbi:MAG TPA: transglutaminase-like domain-containing protein [Azospira sp.]|nr:transglutaminase-like domain-containing protein [Azospira sp.]
MKRRAFLALAGGLAVAPGSVLAAKKTNTAKPDPKAAAKKAAGKATAKGAGGKASGRAATANLRPAGNAPVSGHVAGMRPAPLPRPRQQSWRHYDLVVKVGAPDNPQPLRAWIPLPQENDWQRVEDLDWQGNYAKAGLRRDGDSGLLTFFAEWPAAIRAPSLELRLRLGTRQRLFDITRRGTSLETEEVLNQNLAAAGPWPQDVIADLSERIMGRIREPMPQALAIYDWVVDHGLSCAGAPESIQSALCAKNDGGAGLTGVFVALCRASGIPARRVSGQRLGPSRQSPSLGASGDVSAAQHWRAEFHAPFYGWVPVDPADAVLAQRQDGDSGALRRRLFGFWEMNWAAYFNGDGVHLPLGPAESLATVDRPLLAQVERDGSVRLLNRQGSISLEAHPSEG